MASVARRVIMSWFLRRGILAPRAASRKPPAVAWWYAMRVQILGLGYVGLPAAGLLAAAGHRVLGVDPDAARRAAIGEGLFFAEDEGLREMLGAAMASGALTLHASPQPAEVHVVAVPTPLGAGQAPELGFVWAAAGSLRPVLAAGDLVLLESTVPVGTTAALAALLPGAEVAHAPERVLPGALLEELRRNPRIVGGVTPRAAERARAFYRGFVQGEVTATDAASAEMAKLVENSFRDVNIAFANEVALLAARHGLDAHHVIALANRHPRVAVLRPGPGVGGHCIAVDPWFLAHGMGDAARLIPAARAVDAATRLHWLEAASALCLAGMGVTCLGLAYKADVGDLRESPALWIAQALSARHPGQVRCVEPLLDALPDGLAASTLEDALAGDDALLLLVDHAAFRAVPPARRRGRIVLDPRGAWRDR